MEKRLMDNKKKKFELQVIYEYQINKQIMLQKYIWKQEMYELRRTT